MMIYRYRDGDVEVKGVVCTAKLNANIYDDAGTKNNVEAGRKYVVDGTVDETYFEPDKPVKKAPAKKAVDAEEESNGS